MFTHSAYWFPRPGVLPGQLSHLIFQALDLPGQPLLFLRVLLGQLAESAGDLAANCFAGRSRLRPALQGSY